MLKDPKNWVLVTGSAKRLGAAIALYLAQKGYSIGIHYRRSHLEALNTRDRCREYGVEVEILQGDFSTQDGTKQFIDLCLEKLPRLAFLVNNVGNYPLKSALETDLAEGEALFQSNLWAPFALIKGLLPPILDSKGAIVNIGVSGLFRMQANTSHTFYNMTKQNLLFLTRSVAKELASSGVRLNMVSPGYLENAVDLPVDPSKLPMGRPGRLDEVARVVAFLLDPDSSYLTGQNIEVAGGVGL